MILTRKYILENREDFILENVEDWQIKDLSVDVSLGQYVFVWENNKWIKQDITDGLAFYPGMFVLAYTNEWIGAKANTNICCEFKLKSTAARQGLNHSFAGWIETGYFLPLCLELSTFKPLAIRYGDLIGQIIFHTTTDNSVDYTIKGNYQITSNLEELKKNWKPEDILPKTMKNKFV